MIQKNGNRKKGEKTEYMSEKERRGENGKEERKNKDEIATVAR